jgi:DNA adenine methylase
LFYYLAWWSYGGKGEHFCGHRIEELHRAKNPVRRSLSSVSATLARGAQRLANVLIEKRDFADCIQRYDSPATLFYLDPAVHFVPA